MNKKIFFDKDFEVYFGSKDPMELAKNLDGKLYRDYANRKTKQFFFKGSSYFLKYHGPVGWKELLKNLIQIKIPVVGAEREWKALLKLQSIKVNCPEPIAFMSKGWNPANKESFLVTKDLEGTISLEDFFKNKMDRDISVAQKRDLLKNVARICRAIHMNGLNHRDLYLCHFHIEKDTNSTYKDIALIDLHRAQIRKKVPLRWSTKDIGGLLHSIIQFGISEADCYRFLEVYFDSSLRELLIKNKNFIRRARSRAYSMYMKPICEEIDITDNKMLSDSSGYVKEIGKDYRWIGSKALVSSSVLELLQDLDGAIKNGKVIKQEQGHHIVSLDLDGKRIFIKRYQVKSAWHLVRKIFSQSRAFNSWIAIHWLRAVNISTVEPILIYEKLNFFTSLDAYLITSEIKGEILSDVCKENMKDALIVARINSLFKRLKWIGFNHGDAKTSNFFLDKDNLIVFDLDISRRRTSSFMIEKKINKDKDRLIKSVEDNLGLHTALSKRLFD
jgi:heptose I phosphotransferase